jgi:hypothetical protein
MTHPKISICFLGLGGGAAMLGLLTYGLGFWLASHGNIIPSAGILMLFGILCILASGLSLVLSLIARVTGE